MEKTVLKRGEVQSYQLNSGAILRCETGTLWLTFNGQGEDVILRRNESWVAPKRGKAVVQALEAGALRRSEGAKSRSPLTFEWPRLPRVLTLRH